MRVVCPSCAAEYEVPASRMTPQRKVRCVRCGGEWLAVEEAEQPPPPVGAVDAVTTSEPTPPPEAARSVPPVTAMDRLAASVSPPPRNPALIAVWVMTLVILVAALIAVIAWRDPVVRAWPPSAWLLGAVDHPAPGPRARCRHGGHAIASHAIASHERIITPQQDHPSCRGSRSPAG